MPKIYPGLKIVSVPTSQTEKLVIDRILSIQEGFVSLEKSSPRLNIAPDLPEA